MEGESFHGIQKQESREIAKHFEEIATGQKITGNMTERRLGGRSRGTSSSSLSVPSFSEMKAMRRSGWNGRRARYTKELMPNSSSSDLRVTRGLDSGEGKMMIR